MILMILNSLLIWYFHLIKFDFFFLIHQFIKIKTRVYLFTLTLAVVGDLKLSANLDKFEVYLESKSTHLSVILDYKDFLICQ
jgi:hypothetical protein